MEVRVTQHDETISGAGATWGSYYEYYDIYEFDIGGGCIVRGRHNIGISTAKNIALDIDGDAFYALGEAREIIAELQRRGFVGIALRHGAQGYFNQFDPARLTRPA